MKLLMTTEKLDTEDSIFAFSHLWVKTIASQVEHLTVIALSVGVYDLPKNVTVLSLGKEKGIGKWGRLLRFYTYIWKERKQYDAVFVHMNQIYVLLGGLFWKVWKKRIALWYTHRAVSRSLKWATKLVDVVYTAAEESFNIQTEKKQVLGHGIDTSILQHAKRISVLSKNTINIVSVGRITPIKNLETLIKAVAILKEKNISCAVSLIGPVVTERDIEYKKQLDALIKEKGLEDSVVFTGGKTAGELRNMLWESDIHVNLCPTGGLDKAVIEAVCAGLHSFASNTAFNLSYGIYADTYIYEYANEADLAKKIHSLLSMDKDTQEQIRQYIEKDWIKRFDIHTLIQTLLKGLYS